MLKRIFVDSNNQVTSSFKLHGTLVLFRIGANLERPEHEWSELTANRHVTSSFKL